MAYGLTWYIWTYVIIKGMCSSIDYLEHWEDGGR